MAPPRIPAPGPAALRNGYILTALAATLWGTAGVTVKYLFTSIDIDPVTLAQMRVSLSCIIGGIALAVLRPRALRVRLADLPFLAFYGAVCLTGTQITYYWAIHESSVAVAIFLQFLAPILTSLYEVAVLKRRPGKMTGVVLLAAVGGSLLLLFGQGDGVASSPLGLLAGLVSAVALALYTLVGQRGVHRYDPWTLVVFGAAASSLLWAFVKPPWTLLAHPWTPANWGFFLYLAVVTTLLPFGLFLTGLRHIGPTSAILTATIEPVWATILAGLVLGEEIGWAQAAGCALILASIIALRFVPGAAITDKPETAAQCRPGSASADS
jgi:drug/metabolite transporter (DMT)-like permease